MLLRLSRGLARAFAPSALLAVFCFLLAFPAPASSDPRPSVIVTDMAGRTVEIPQPVQRLVISEGRYVELLALLRPDNPLKGVVGMMTPIGDVLPGLEAQLTTRAGGDGKTPLFSEDVFFGLFGGRTASAEKIISLKPELAIFGLQDHGPGPKDAELIAQLEKAGVAVVFIDFRLDPLKNTIPSITLVGKALAAEDRAKAYADFHAARLAKVKAGLAGVTRRPRVFFQAHVGRFSCCVGFADGMLGPFVGAAGGENIADAAAPGPVGRHTAEFLLTQNPDVLIGTASGTLKDLNAGASYLALGDGITAERARKSMRKAFSGSAYQALDAVANKRAHGLWHNFYNSPFNIVALEALAGWIHPERFPDSDPQGSITQIYKTFLGFELDGVYVADLE